MGTTDCRTGASSKVGLDYFGARYFSAAQREPGTVPNYTIPLRTPRWHRRALVRPDGLQFQNPGTQGTGYVYDAAGHLTDIWYTPAAT